MRSFSLVLLRRLLFRAPLNQRVPLYDVLSAQSLSTIERLLLHSLVHEPSVAVRHKAVDTVSDLANNSMSRGRPWHALQRQAFAMAEDENPATRESAFRVFAGSPNLIMDLQPETVVQLLQKGLEDPSNVEVSTRTSSLSQTDSRRFTRRILVPGPCLRMRLSSAVYTNRQISTDHSFFSHDRSTAFIHFRMWRPFPFSFPFAQYSM